MKKGKTLQKMGAAEKKEDPKGGSVKHLVMWRNETRRGSSSVFGIEGKRH